MWGEREELKLHQWLPQGRGAVFLPVLKAGVEVRVPPIGSMGDGHHSLLRGAGAKTEATLLSKVSMEK